MKLVAAEVSAEGKRELATVSYQGFIDVNSRLELRERSGLLGRRVVVGDRTDPSRPPDVGFGGARRGKWTGSRRASIR